jgi:hypothetical protein
MAYFPDRGVAVAIQTNSTAAEARSFSEPFVLEAVRLVSEPETSGN